MKQKIKKAAVLKGIGDLCANNGTGVFSRVFKRVYRSACKTCVSRYFYQLYRSFCYNISSEPDRGWNQETKKELKESEDEI